MSKLGFTTQNFFTQKFSKEHRGGKGRWGEGTVYAKAQRHKKMMGSLREVYSRGKGGLESRVHAGMVRSGGKKKKRQTSSRQITKGHEHRVPISQHIYIQEPGKGFQAES